MSKQTHCRKWLLLVLMLCASLTANLMRPRNYLHDKGTAFALTQIIPEKFGEWEEVTEQPVVISDPGQVENIRRIYSQTLSRTYQNAKGYRVMLSIAYGSDQRDAMQVHKPEICYPAQGFTIESKRSDVLHTPLGDIPVTRLITNMGERHEPVMYWVIVGETAVSGGVQKKIAEMNYGLKGKIPDGLIFRVSSIDKSAEFGELNINKFSIDFLMEMKPEFRKRLAGV